MDTMLEGFAAYSSELVCRDNEYAVLVARALNRLAMQEEGSF